MSNLNKFGERVGHNSFNRPKFWRKTRAVKRQVVRTARTNLHNEIVNKMVVVMDTDSIKTVDAE